jgi:uncharacterized membrane protein
MQLVVIGYAETFLAALAMEELDSVRCDLVMRRDEMAAIVRDDGGSFTTCADADIPPDGSAWTTLWRVLFASFFSVPVPEMPSGGDASEILQGFDRAGFDPEFIRRVREMVKPGTSALFILASTAGPDAVVAALEAYGGTVLQSEIPAETGRLLLETLDADEADPRELPAVALEGRG